MIFAFFFFFFYLVRLHFFFFFFFFNDTATTEIYTLSLHDALPISSARNMARLRRLSSPAPSWSSGLRRIMKNKADRKSTRLNSSHGYISYAVFCLKKKKKKDIHNQTTRKHNATYTNVVLVRSLVAD